MKKNKIILILGLTAAVMFSAGCGKAQDASKESKPVMAKEAKNVVETSGVVKASNIENIVIDLPMGAQAKALNINVRDGQKVKKGDRLVELDLSDYNTLLTQKQKTIDADWTLRKDMITTNQKNAQSLKISAEQAELDGLKAKLNRNYISSGSIICDMDNAVVSEVNYNKGDVITAQQKVLSLMELNSIYIVANVDEEFIKDVQEGRSVTIIPKFDKTYKVTGKVTKIPSKAVKQNGETTIPVEISIDGNSKLLPDYSVDVEISKN